MYIRRRWILLFITIVIVSVVWFLYSTFFGKNEADQVCCEKHYVAVPKVLTITESTPIPILDSSKANQQITYNILNQVQEGLMRLGKNNVPVPGLAESYQVSPDYRTYTFTLRQQAVWSDGQPVMAKDFQYAWLRALSPENDYAFRYLFYGIQGAQKYATGEAEAGKVGIQVSGERQLTIRLDKPDPNFLSLVTLTPFFPLRQDVVEKFGEDYATSAMPESMRFAGPYRLKSFNPEKAILVKNENYWDKNNVKLQEVKIEVNVDQEKRSRLYRGELSSMTKVDKKYVKGIKDSKEVRFILKSTSDYLQINQQKKIMQNIKIRKAIKLTLDQNVIASYLADGSTAASGLVPPVLITSGQQVFKSKIQTKYSLVEAKRLLQEGLKELGLSKSLTLTLITYSDTRSTALSEEVKNKLLNLGITVEVGKYKVSEKEKKESKGEYDLSINEWYAEYHDPSIFLSIFNSNAIENTSGFTNPNYDSLLQQAAKETDPVKRDQLLQQAERYLVVDQAAVVPLVYMNDIRLQKSYVKDVLYHPFGADYSLKWASYTPPKQIEATK